MGVIFLRPTVLVVPLKCLETKRTVMLKGKVPLANGSISTNRAWEERMRKAGRLREHDQDTGETKSVVSHLSFETTIEVLDSHGGVPSKALFDAVDEVSC